jgi:two-component system, chemotaxis family, protein-glutamate methylesterase/glutaminase
MLNKTTSIVVIGTSAGGINALPEFFQGLPNGINAAFFVVIHVSKTGLGEFLLHRLQKFSNLNIKLASDNEIIQTNTIYIAPADYHLIVKPETIVLGQGPAENRWRPSIDVLFRSAAAAFGSRTIGIILTGLLNDGTSGMIAIKKCGGVCMVQDPNEAEFPDMPLSVLNMVDVDYTVPLRDMPPLLSTIADRVAFEEYEIPAEVKAEAELAEKVSTAIDGVKNLGYKSLYSCPDCGGGLWEINDGKDLHYRCHTGHVYTINDLDLKQSEELEETFWIALRMMEERRSLLINLSDCERKKGLAFLAETQLHRAQEMEVHIGRLKDILFATKTLK